MCLIRTVIAHDHKGYFQLKQVDTANDADKKTPVKVRGFSSACSAKERSQHQKGYQDKSMTSLQAKLFFINSILISMIETSLYMVLWPKGS